MLLTLDRQYRIIRIVPDYGYSCNVDCLLIEDGSLGYRQRDSEIKKCGDTATGKFPFDTVLSVTGYWMAYTPGDEWNPK